MAKTTTVLVEEVEDGDSFVTKAGQKIRLAGVDAPEKGKPGAAKARGYLKRQIEGQKIVIRPVAKDKYDRTIAYAYKQGKSINKKLKKRGL